MNYSDKLKQFLPKGNFSPLDLLVASDFHLRFELGDQLENGTVERVNQSVERALMVFERLFDSSDSIVVLTKTYEYLNPVDILWGDTPGYFESQFDDYEQLEKQVLKEFVEEMDEMLPDENGVIEKVNFSVTHVLTMYETKLEKINIKNILRAIANSEMGFEPAIGRQIWFFNPRNGVAFNMYDDRGCIVLCDDGKILLPLYQTHSYWLVDNYRAEFDGFFANLR